MGKIIQILILFAILTGCSTTRTSFHYHYYGLEGMNYEEGELLGPFPENDLPFKECKPTTEHPRPCIIMFTDDFFELKKDYLILNSK